MDTSVDSLSSTVFTQDLSAMYWQDSAHSTIQNILSSLKQVNADIAAAKEEIPTDPYERLKWEHCHKDTKPFDFDSIEVPEDFCMKKSYQELLNISDKHSANLNSHMETAMTSGFNIEEHSHFGNAFATLNDNQFVLDKTKLTNHFLFIDMIRNVPIEYIKNNPKEFNRKVISKFIEIYQ